VNDLSLQLPRIESVSIRGFRSLANIENLKLPQLTVLIGANGSGKSNFIRFFEMLGWMLHGQNLQKFIVRSGGGDDQLFMGARITPTMDAEIRLATDLGYCDYRFSLEHVTAGDKLIFVDEACRYIAGWGSNSAEKWFSAFQENGTGDWYELDSGNQETSIVNLIKKPALFGAIQSNVGKTYIPEGMRPIYSAAMLIQTLRQGTIFQFHDTSEKAYIRLSWDARDNAWLRPDGANVAPILLRLREQDITRYKLIVRQISRVLPAFDDFILQPTEAGKVQLRWQGKYSDKTFGAHLTSDGSLRLFCLLTLLNLPKDMLPEVLILDEPELGLHPHAITLISAMLKRLAHDRQIIIATQSPYMVDCFELENVIVADLKDGATSLRTMPREQYQEWLDDEYQVSDLWLKEAIGGGA
jgi:predicted ATPase